jgi:2-polyprenyl-3-methyl-5-hydroxy-6-metoxy-1,4-benzoquinol methylase
MTEPKRDPSHDLFQNYARHYDSMEKLGRGQRVPDDLERLKRDRLPPWIDEIPKDARILDAGCAQGHLLLMLARVGFENLTGVDLSAQLLAEARARVPQAQLIQADIRPESVFPSH